MRWHSITVEEVFKQMGSSPKGLGRTDVEKKRAQFGRNELLSKKKRSPILIFLSQFTDTMILVLIGAAIISAFIGELSDSGVIVVIIILNAVIGFIQEFRAEK